jgi:type II secretory pathway component GspD/PulD (secretin)
MKRIMSIVDKLDIRRAQVWVEAILVDITSNKASELGINWAGRRHRLERHGSNRHVQSGRGRFEHW